MDATPCPEKGQHRLGHTQKRWGVFQSKRRCCSQKKEKHHWTDKKMKKMFINSHSCFDSKLQGPLPSPGNSNWQPGHQPHSPSWHSVPLPCFVDNPVGVHIIFPIPDCNFLEGRNQIFLFFYLHQYLHTKYLLIYCCCFPKQRRCISRK